MGQKVNPIGLRIGITRKWDSIWYEDRHYKSFLVEDVKIRNFFYSDFNNSGLVKVFIERFPETINITLHTAKPGVVIGQKGSKLEAAKKKLKKNFKIEKKIDIKVKEVKKPECVAQFVSESISNQISQRMPFRKVVKQELRKSMRSGVAGIKITVSGRLNGADMARTESYKEGRIPLHTLRGKIDYGFKEALTTYGLVGIKVWIYTGYHIEVSEQEDKYSVKRRVN